MTSIDEIKELLSEERYKIKLHDVVADLAREAVSLTSHDNFPTQLQWSTAEFLDRLKRYEGVTGQLRGVQALLGFWGNEAHALSLLQPARSLCDQIRSSSGVTGWLALRWYPALLLLYSGGIASIAAGKYSNLRLLMQVRLYDPEAYESEPTLVRRVGKAAADLSDVFKTLPGHEKEYAPRSEYLFSFLCQELANPLYLGSSFELYFDEFEVLFALEYAEEYATESHGRIWGPPGRFAWKYGRSGTSPLHRVMEQAKAQGESWPPVKAGLFAGRPERFMEVATEYAEQLGRL